MLRDLKLPDQRHPEKAHKRDNFQPKNQTGSGLRRQPQLVTSKRATLSAIKSF